MPIGIRLPEELKQEAIRLNIQEGMSTKAISEKLVVPLSTVGNWFTRARKEGVNLRTKRLCNHKTKNNIVLKVESKPVNNIKETISLSRVELLKQKEEHLMKLKRIEDALSTYNQLLEIM